MRTVARWAGENMDVSRRNAGRRLLPSRQRNGTRSTRTRHARPRGRRRTSGGMHGAIQTRPLAPGLPAEGGEERRVPLALVDHPVGYCGRRVGGVRFWSGGPLRIPELRRALKSVGASGVFTFTPVAARELARQRFRFAARLLRAAGHAGWVIF